MTLRKYTMAKINPNDYKPMSAGTTYSNLVTPAEIKRWMDHIGLTYENIQKAIEQLKNHKFKESTLWQKIKGYVYFGIYDLIYKELTWENVAKILTNLDKLLPLMPSGFTAKLLLELDKLAEKWHASFKDES